MNPKATSLGPSPQPSDLLSSAGEVGGTNGTIDLPVIRLLPIDTMLFGVSDVSAYGTK